MTDILLDLIEEEIEYIDHINGNGSKHRKKLNNTDMYRWLIKNKYPEGFQVLCMNCNFAKGMYGICPHIKEYKNGA